MRQTTLCVPLEAKPESCSRLAALIDRLRTCADGDHADNFGIVQARLPTLHFMSLSVFPAQAYDPLFILEANFDGPPGPFWGQLEAVFGADLREIIRCCKRPVEHGALYDAVCRPGSGAPVAGFLEACTQRPSVYHHGNRGLTRDRIRADHALFLSIQETLDAAPVPPGHGPRLVHRQLRGHLLRRFPWLDEPAPVRIGMAETIADRARLLAFAVAVMLLLSAPGLVLERVLGDDRWYWLVLFVTAIACWVALWRNSKAIRGTEVVNRVGVPWRNIVAMIVAGVLGSLLLAAGLLAVLLALRSAGWLVALLGVSFAHLGFWAAMWLVPPGLAGAVLVVLPFLILSLRLDEIRDSNQDAPPIDEAMLREMLRREDWITQNHMGSIVLIKPGILRATIIRAGHLGLGLLLRVVARDGYLGTMRTVHFAHWAFLNNGSRLLFFSNFDHSWGSYLDDFIEKAHVGLTLAWGCGVGFPSTRMLILDGASHGRQFKSWALASRAVSRFWYSAYRDLTVDQIERNHRIANGLRRRRLTAKEAETWALDL